MLLYSVRNISITKIESISATVVICVFALTPFQFS